MGDKKMINLKNKSAVILSPERSEWVSRSHVTSVESVVNDGAKTQCYSAKRDLYGDFAYAQPLKMTMISCFALFFSLINITESQAECTASTNNWATSCYNTWKPGVADNCGDGCTYNYVNGKLTVTATKPGAIIPKGMFSPKYYEPGVLPTITDIEIDGEFAKITNNAFLDSEDNISGKDGMLHLKSVDYNTFQGSTLTGTIIISDQVKTITGQWYFANLNATVILPPTIKSISGWAVYGLNLGTNAKIYCGVENCEELFKNVDCDAIGEQYSTLCKNNLKTLLSSGKLLPYPDGCTKMGATGCTKCKNENFKLNDGECDRLRYTPAEAAKVLKNDNTNEVTITFKK